MHIVHICVAFVRRLFCTRSAFVLRVCCVYVALSLRRNNTPACLQFGKRCVMLNVTYMGLMLQFSARVLPAGFKLDGVVDACRKLLGL